ncbi:MAG: phosphoglycerate mutase (2,3-diphosphoglycerate-independent) [Bdellovibrionales bacterium RIFOXYD12_FULL_39_22]|nr:MAG: phosphoglycerate mutase (2,3-diphosphoglycerate-independent) [Bdellovibrionales bacterium RIFOXYB1_FULL_39_21]OFZ43425.1 MAG: phosphoglycerate mutase (2,3-diphosphoglycerate-independent) [Bdellovibrionales bacterium RIFOXYC12_FULL_39_17]OFZ46968.1 MAG: phosphoglycerate mutase (2,3-diphosphoglycerate-independent) [Bdellovibrionales bacterium RIFOXYC1_FULL_39_130]OFZ71489.1 MAG: phosphoglycerate mutase (2,3-diphosphoglycerate-independent) [Bdellovibrionales bacterium RIFOXYC2_FULL_39_8]OF
MAQIHTLNRLPQFQGRIGPVVLVILDGVGVGKEYPGNAVWLARPENYNRFISEAKKNKLYTQLRAHGKAIGLPSDGDMGNSEVGHNALGAGQIYAQGAKLVGESLDSGRFFKSDNWKNVVITAANQNKTIHFIGLLSDGNVHSNISHLFKILEGCKKDGIKKIRIHPLLDGRDVAPDSGLLFIDKLENKLVELRNTGLDAQIASGGGRMHVTMDRYGSDWNIVRRGWYAHVLGQVDKADIHDNYPGYFRNAKSAIMRAREIWPSKQDQFNPSFVIVDDNMRPIGKMEDGDAVINFNFRGDRAIQISQAFELDNFPHFDRLHRPKVNYAGLLEYDGDSKLPQRYLVSPPEIKNTASEYLCAMKIRSYAGAETHKYGHVTYFWNGNKSGFIDAKLETYENTPSDPNEMIERNPKMKAREVTKKLLSALDSKQYKFLRINLANGDMVGHTGNINACVESIKEVDTCLADIVSKVSSQNGIVIITADHGNSEEKIDEKGKIITSHTLNPVPFLIIDNNFKREYEIDVTDKAKFPVPGIANVAATFLNLLGYQAPEFYEKSLLKFK